MGAILVAVCIYCGFCGKKKVEDKTFLSTTTYEDLPLQAGKATRSTSLKSSDSTGAPGSASSRGLAISVDKSVEFSYEELAKATNDFSIAHKIGQGGFGAVYYAELRGERAAIKKMDMQATREFLAELKVLTHVHHLNLTAEEAMTPIESAFSLDVNSKLVWEAMRKILARGHSRVPVYFRNPKNIIGLLLVKSLLTVRPETETPVSAVSIRRIPRVPADMPLYDILNEFQKGSSHMAAVVRTRGKN